LRLEYWIAASNSIAWRLGDLPEPGDVVVLGEYGVCRVTARRNWVLDQTATAYDVEWIRDPTPQERRQARKQPRMSCG
jgi:hypothetical protein